MKTILRIAALLRRAWLLYKIRSLEIQLQGIEDALLYLRDEDLRIRIFITRNTVRRVLVKLRGEYVRTLRPGVRPVWHTA